MENNDLKKVNGYYVNKKNVGNRIFRIRNDRNDTLEEFGKLFGAEKSNVLKWENGSSLPNKSRIEKIAKKGNLTVNELLFGDVEEFLSNNIDIIANSIDVNVSHISKEYIIKYIIKEHNSNNINITINNISEIIKIVAGYLNAMFDNKYHNINETIIYTYSIMKSELLNLKRYINKKEKEIKTKDKKEISKYFKEFQLHIDNEIKNLKNSENLTLQKAKYINDIYIQKYFNNNEIFDSQIIYNEIKNIILDEIEK